MTIYYQNAYIFDGDTLLNEHSMAVEKDKVCAIIADVDLPENAHIKTLNGGILTPGYVELQANGGGGVLFNDQPTVEGLKAILKAHRQFGTVAMLPTFITDEKNKLDTALQAIRDGIRQNLHGLIGGHFEGPFLNLEKKGTHQANFIRQPDESDYQRFYRSGLGNSLITVAPECVSADFIRHLSKQVFRVSAGHTMATKADMVTANQAGLTGVTHLYNAMPTLQGREPAVIGSAVALGLYCGIIVDGIHSDAFSLQTAFNMLGKDHLMLVTDSMHTIGAPEIEQFMLTGQRVFVRGNRLANEGGHLAGAHITMEHSVQNAKKFMQASTVDVLTMAITTPATYIGRDDLATPLNRHIDDILYLNEQTLAIQAMPLTT